MSARPIDGSDSSFWPTAQARDGDARRSLSSSEGAQRRFAAGRRNLTDAASISTWPTTAGDAKASGSRNLEGSAAHPGVSLTDAVTSGTSTVSRRARPGSPDGMVLNPLFVESLMGFPAGWTCTCANAAKQIGLGLDEEGD
jgi:hypothetical protein